MPALTVNITGADCEDSSCVLLMLKQTANLAETGNVTAVDCEDSSEC